MRLSFCLLLCCFATISHGQSPATSEPEFDSAIVADSRGFVVNGIAMYQELGNDMFASAIYIDAPTPNVASIRSRDKVRLEMKVATKKITRRRLARLLVKSIAINNPGELLTTNAAAMSEFMSAFDSNLFYGDHIVIDKTPKGVSVSLNSVFMVSIESPQFFNALLNTWIGDVPPSSDFKLAILGEKPNEEDQAAFYQINYSEERRLQVEAWKAAQLLAIEEAAAEAEALAQAEIEAEQEAIRVAAAKAAQAKKEAARKAKAATEKAAAAALAASASVVEVAPQAVAPTPKPKPAKAEANEEFSAERLLEMQLYASELLKKSRKNIFYPKLSRRLGQTGKVMASVTIDRNGEVLNIALTEEANHDLLNNAVKKGIKKSAPYPQMPEKLDGDSFSFNVPVTFTFD